MNKISFQNGVLYNEDFHTTLPTLPDKSVDIIICDLPFQQTKNKWDKPVKNVVIQSVIAVIKALPINRQVKEILLKFLALLNLPFDILLLWREYERIIKDNGAIILFSQGIFTSLLVLTNPKLYKYSIVWKKGNRVTGFLNAKKQLLRNHEDILIFYKKQPPYNPIMTEGEPLHSIGTKNVGKVEQTNYGDFNYNDNRAGSTEKYPTTIIDIPREHPPIFPTQKPVALIEWLLKTFSNEGDTVLDNCAGSMSTGVAADNSGRKYILVEQLQEYVVRYSHRLKK